MYTFFVAEGLQKSKDIDFSRLPIIVHISKGISFHLWTFPKPEMVVKFPTSTT